MLSRTPALYHPVAKWLRDPERSPRLVKLPVAFVTLFGLANPLLLVLRKRATNAVVPGSTDPDVDDLIVDLVKVDGRWVVTRTERTNAVEGKGTCAPASSP